MYGGRSSEGVRGSRRKTRSRGAVPPRGKVRGDMHVRGGAALSTRRPRLAPRDARRRTHCKAHAHARVRAGGLRGRVARFFFDDAPDKVLPTPCGIERDTRAPGETRGKLSERKMEARWIRFSHFVGISSLFVLAHHSLSLSPSPLPDLSSAFVLLRALKRSTSPTVLVDPAARRVANLTRGFSGTHSANDGALPSVDVSILIGVRPHCAPSNSSVLRGYGIGAWLRALKPDRRGHLRIVLASASQQC